jgi:hypothetical protein
MKKEILEKIIELLKDGYCITTSKFISEIYPLYNKNSSKELNFLIKEKFVERIVIDHIDVISFKTSKLERLIKLTKV